MNKSVVFGAVGDIAIVGDIAAHTQLKGPAWPMEAMLPVNEKADILFGNMESVILPDDYLEEEISSRGLMTRFDGTVALKEAGFNFMNLANNHILDGGTS